MSFADVHVLFERMWCTKRPTYWSSVSVLLAVALYDTNTAFLVRRMLTTTLYYPTNELRNAYNPLNRQQRLAAYRYR